MKVVRNLKYLNILRLNGNRNKAHYALNNLANNTCATAAHKTESASRYCIRFLVVAVAGAFAGSSGQKCRG
jgi:hypothetical protein